ncbi:MAG: 16S rRNA (adenine(1518)-N(6)/adenine(1519)-N(6))-dimethyltransferase RsmA [Candidatus Gastranaerophilales bacterium]|nr:16S rRNA (adenine(1518)-N(6)/adenine(1519)-N(6))-dimethyltransferase RsmA [Candidatus Gastranaerophilales bacterium]
MNYIQRAKKFNTKKRLGQNFLVDESVLDYIICAAGEIENTTVLEIGPGIGFLTEKLCKNAKEVIACEIDDDAINFLNKNLLPSNKNLKLIHNDILKTNICDLTKKKPIKIIANIPYYITSPIIAHLLGEIDDLNNQNRSQISEIILMVQYEVAKRIVASENSDNKEYGLLSILSQFYCDVEFLKKIKANSFYPAPKVDSALVRFKVKNEPAVKTDDYTFLKKVIKGCFLSRRKNVKNSLIQSGFDKECIIKTLKDLNIDENVRGEKLSLETINLIAKKIKENLNV